MKPNLKLTSYTERTKINFHWFDYLLRLNSGTLGNPSNAEFSDKLMNVLLVDHQDVLNLLKDNEIKDRIVVGILKRQGIVRSTVVHPGWIQWERIKSPKDKSDKSTAMVNQLMRTRGMEGPFGKYQYQYVSKKGKISLIKLVNYNFDKKDIWEIFAYEDKSLFDDTKRFNTKKEAEQEIIRLLK